MAQKTIVQLIDDLDGTSSDSIETVTFGLDGAVYEIDLSDDNAETLRDNLAEFITSGRRTGGRAKRGTTTPATAGAGNGTGRSREQTQAIREWACKNGHEVAERGRIPTSIIEAFEAAADNPKGRKLREPQSNRWCQRHSRLGHAATPALLTTRSLSSRSATLAFGE
jgi:hypothetical protein